MVRLFVGRLDSKNHYANTLMCLDILFKRSVDYIRSMNVWVISAQFAKSKINSTEEVTGFLDTTKGRFYVTVDHLSGVNACNFASSLLS